jgi:hypothetical protein
MFKKTLVVMLLFILPVMAAIPGFTCHEAWAAVELNTNVMTDSLPRPVTGISEDEARSLICNTFPDITRNKTLIIKQDPVTYLPGTYNFFWNDSEYIRPDQKGARITASVDAEAGRINSFFYRPGLDLYRGRAAQYTRQEALVIANNFLRRTHPELMDRLTYQSSDRFFPEHSLENTHNFYWSRMENGIPVTMDGISINIDAVLGVITEYHLSWHNSTFPEPQDLIPVDDFTSRLLSRLGVYPSFQLLADSYNDSSAKSMIPVYMVNTRADIFDARTGQAMNWDGSLIEDNYLKAYEYPPRASEKSISPVVAISDPGPDLNQLKKTAEDFFGFVGAEGQIAFSQLSKQGICEFSLQHDKGMYHQLAINTLNGEIQEYQSWNADNVIFPGNTSSTIDYEEAQSLGRAFLEKINPQKSSQVILSFDAPNQVINNRYILRFARIHNGIVYNRDSIEMQVDKSSGKIVSYQLNWSSLGYVPAGSLIDEAQGVSIIIQQSPLELVYVLCDYEYGSSQAGAALLGYRLKEPLRVDARTGTRIGYWGMAETDDSRLQEWRTHWIFPTLELLNRSGLIPEQGLDPDSSINRREAIRIISRSYDPNRFLNDDELTQLAFVDISSSDPDRGAFLSAVKSGMIRNGDKLDPDLPIYREELAEWLVNCLSYREIALMDKSFQLTAIDAEAVSPDKINYVAIASGLGLLGNDEHGRFNPQTPCTWAEVATAAVKIKPYM